jgi:hypothetical protein
MLFKLQQKKLKFINAKIGSTPLLTKADLLKEQCVDCVVAYEVGSYENREDIIHTEISFRFNKPWLQKGHHKNLPLYSLQSQFSFISQKKGNNKVVRDEG